MPSNRPRVLIEDWLPIAELGVESQRESGASSALPPTRYLHVWWARRPLICARAAVLGSLLPAWSPGLADRFPTDKDYRRWFLELLGVHPDVVGAYRQVCKAKAAGRRIKNPYPGPRAFTVSPDPDRLETARHMWVDLWGTGTPVVLDPTAGGGSIPFEALRYGCRTLANELNPVAAFILEGTLELPARFGPDLAGDIARWGLRWAGQVTSQVEGFFPSGPDETAMTYIWAHTVACPELGLPVPLVPSWWLRRGDRPVAVRMTPDRDAGVCRFEIAHGRSEIDFDPTKGTVKDGVGTSPWTGATIPSEYIKAEARAGRMTRTLYALAVRRGRTRGFRTPTDTDLDAVRAAEAELARRLPTWEAADLIPTEPIPEGSKTREPLAMGFTRWRDLFTPRQLLVAGTAMGALRDLEAEITSAEGPERAGAVCAYLGMALGKLLNWNALLASWDVSRQKLRSVFDRHDFSTKWTFGEMNPTVGGSGLEWAVDQVVDAYRGIAGLVEPSRATLFWEHPERAADLVEVRRGDAGDLPYPDGSVHAVVVDPPYYDNVQYAELSDYFYVWERRAVGHLFPHLFDLFLTDKDTEAVANPARFAAVNKRRSKALATADYEAKMTRIFAEARRVLTDDGVLTVMFTHKKVEAWDTLGNALITAGFQVEASWPVRTESEHSLHQAKKAAAASTILLVCRKRPAADTRTWWEDLQGELRRTVRERATEFATAGIDGVDLFLAVFGPALSVISRRWPVHTSETDPDTGEARVLRVAEALDLAREEVANLRLERLAGGLTDEFDPVTNWYLLAWDAFGAAEFPFDEARKLAMALGVDIDDITRARLATKDSGNLRLTEPRQRRQQGAADPEAADYERLIDAAHALMVAWADDGIQGADRFLADHPDLRNDPRFTSLLGALAHAIPRVRDADGALIRPEARALDTILPVLFPDIDRPPDPTTGADQETLPLR